jgi:hypothetical protein
VTKQSERVVYEESVRTVNWQRELLEGLRSRAGALLATAFVATAFFAAQALPGRREDPLEWLATSLFLVVIVSMLIVLIPWRLQFAHHPHSLIAYHLTSIRRASSTSSTGRSRIGTVSTTTRTGESSKRFSASSELLVLHWSPRSSSG